MSIRLVWTAPRPVIVVAEEQDELISHDLSLKQDEHSEVKTNHGCPLFGRAGAPNAQNAPGSAEAQAPRPSLSDLKPVDL